MRRQSAGLLMFRRSSEQAEILLVHPGGPFWARKDAGAWSIPKGEYSSPESALDAAVREFAEETGFHAHGPYTELGTIKQACGKLVTAWAFAGDCDPAQLVSNLVRMEWPPRSGRFVEFPEVDRAGWFTLPDARRQILASQQPLLEHFAIACREQAL